MKNCNGCKYALWTRTEKGKLHPSGDGKCGKKIELPKLPASMWWLWESEPKPMGGYINRRGELKEHCVYWSET